MPNLLRTIRMVFLPLLFIICLGFAPGRMYSTEAGGSAAADPFVKTQREGVANNPKALTFAIRLKDNKNRFHQGEIIRVELAFASMLQNTYQLDGGLYDRGGRLDVDEYRIDRLEDAVDPLKDYQQSHMGGIRSMPILEKKPYRIVRDLNEYIRFDKAGKYRLYVVSGRVRREPTEKERAEARQPQPIFVPVTSNIIEFTILPADAEWARKQLQSAQTALVAAPRYVDARRREEEIRSARRVIRFLGTEESARYMVRHMEDAQGEYGFGLMGSPFRATVVKEMAEGLDAPDCAVSDWYLYVLVSCSSPHRTAPHPGKQAQEKIKLWEQEEAKAQLARKTYQDAYLKRLAAAVLNKEDRAKAVSLGTLLSQTASGPKDWQVSLPAGFAERLPAELTQVFFDLPATTQQTLLIYHWSWIKGPGIMPVLERYYANPTQGTDWTDPTADGFCRASQQGMLQFAAKAENNLKKQPMHTFWGPLFSLNIIIIIVASVRPRFLNVCGFEL